MALLKRRQVEDRRVARHQRRVSDRRRDVLDRAWLGVITAVVVYGWLVVVPDTFNTIKTNRTNITGINCQFENESRTALRVLIVQSTAASKNIHYPGPPYSQRVKQAKLYAATLSNGDCVKLQEAVAGKVHLKRIPTVAVDPRELAPLSKP